MLQFLVRQKFRFDIGAGFLSYINFILLLVTNAEKLQGFIGISKARYFVLVFALLGILGVWMVGYVLDRYVRIVELYNRESNARNEDLQTIKQQTTT